MAPLKLCEVPNQDIQMDFGGPTYNEKGQEVYLLACIDRFSKLQTAEVFDRVNAKNVLSIFQGYATHNRTRSSLVSNYSSN